MKTDLFQSCGHCWVFQICWHIECSTFTESSFRIWNSSTGIPSPPLALFVVMLPEGPLDFTFQDSWLLTWGKLVPWLEVALCRSPSDKIWVSLEVDYSAPGKPWDDFSPGWQLDCNIMTDWAKKPHWIPELWNLQDINVYEVVVQSLSRVWLFATPWTAARQAPLSSTVSWSLLKFMSIESVILSNHLILCYPFLFLLPSVFPSTRVFSSKLLIQDWFPLGLTGLISLQSKELLRVFSRTTIQKHQFFDAQLSSISSSHIRKWLLEKS